LEEVLDHVQRLQARAEDARQASQEVEITVSLTRSGNGPLEIDQPSEFAPRVERAAEETISMGDAAEQARDGVAAGIGLDADRRTCLLDLPDQGLGEPELTSRHLLTFDMQELELVLGVDAGDEARMARQELEKEVHGELGGILGALDGLERLRQSPQEAKYFTTVLEGATAQIDCAFAHVGLGLDKLCVHAMGRLHVEKRVADPDSIAVFEFLGLVTQCLLVAEDRIAGTQVTEPERTLLEEEEGVPAADERVGDVDITVRRATHDPTFSSEAQGLECASSGDE